MSYHVLSCPIPKFENIIWRYFKNSEDAYLAHPCSISPFEFGCCDTIPLGTPYDILRWAMELVDWSVNGLAMTSSPMNYTQHIIFHPLLSNTFHMAPQNRIISNLLASYLPSMADGKAGALAPAADFPVSHRSGSTGLDGADAGPTAVAVRSRARWAAVVDLCQPGQMNGWWMG